jgi:hypothetical protein
MTNSPADNLASTADPNRHLNASSSLAEEPEDLSSSHALAMRSGVAAARTLRWSRRPARIFGSHFSMKSLPEAWTFHGMNWIISHKPIGMAFDTDSAK